MKNLICIGLILLNCGAIWAKKPKPEKVDPQIAYFHEQLDQKVTFANQVLVDFMNTTCDGNLKQDAESLSAAIQDADGMLDLIPSKESLTEEARDMEVVYGLSYIAHQMVEDKVNKCNSTPSTPTPQTNAKN